MNPLATRRQFLQQTGMGLGSLALLDLLQREQARSPAVDEGALAASLEKLAKQIHDIAARVEAA